MNDYIIMTDSSCDLPAAMAKEYGIEVVPLIASINGTDFENDLSWSTMSPAEFYGALREGAVATTSAPSVEAFTAVMERALKSGKDILYLGFSSALSSCYNTGCIAARMMAAEYPERKILTVDTLAASFGQGMTVLMTAQEMRSGKSIEEAAEFARKTTMNVCHWFTVGDLMYLKRGGRISSTSAAIGAMLNIKPVLHTDNEGRLTTVTKVRGMKAFYAKIAETIRATAIDIENQEIYIIHADCAAEAEKIGTYLVNETGAKGLIMNTLGPVIGAHTGPDTIGIFFVGTER